ncbi:aminotransferase class I/II-fold pyridoxal phosphate-dependent enzyme [Qiania dongpingensis]|uniref:PLP-dependent transferase n=1 Tax=Qiania dongpingensis TaxID=2763669 RepID=A0A7G9G128_9FIRM|nr:PLP-dependent transferase [Qiania dongpingensis]QNM04510.1 PLP-dependent transferase [Qiania dongpingensis]
MAGLYDKLVSYGKTDACPFHMPGHKRDGKTFRFENPFSFDITEIDGFDNLHHPEGILKEAMEQAALTYGAEKSYFLVNGSSGGILAAISACVRPRGKILMARNCHKSAYHALFLRGLRPEYLCPPAVSDWGMCGGVSAEDVEKALSEHPDAEAVFVTSPTYEGICSDIRKISETAHSHGVPLIVDSAHGAHLPFRKKSGESIFPVSAVEAGADIVIESLHKTLPSLTQTAILHKRSDMVKERDLEWYLQVYQSSSPSYVLMASIDSCISYMGSEDGKRAMIKYESSLEGIRRTFTELSHIRLLSERESDIGGGVCYDPSKLVIRGETMSGPKLYELLREEYHIQPEMCTEIYVILMTSVADSDQAFKRLKNALKDIDKKMAADSGWPFRKKAVFLPRPQVVLAPAETEGNKMRACRKEDSEGQISGEFAYIYPPGVPVLAPGERITGEVLEVLSSYSENGFEILGLEDSGGGTIRVLE